jgi:hypothetical protein
LGVRIVFVIVADHIIHNEISHNEQYDYEAGDGIDGFIDFIVLLDFFFFCHCYASALPILNLISKSSNYSLAIEDLDKRCFHTVEFHLPLAFFRTFSCSVFFRRPGILRIWCLVVDSKQLIKCLALDIYWPDVLVNSVKAFG